MSESVLNERPVDGWLLISHGLYWRDRSMGYTGLSREAGRYSVAEMDDTVLRSSGEVSGIHESEAPEFARNCAIDVKLREYERKATEAAAELTRLKAENERLRTLLKPFAAQAERVWDDADDSHHPMFQAFTYGDLRAAARALKES